MKHIKRSSRLNSNRKGLSGPELIGTFILVFLMVFGLIVLYQKVMKGGTKVIECNATGGDCVTGTCDFATQLPALSDKAAGCGTDQLCCINITKSKPIDPLCKGLKAGNKCDKTGVMYCDMASQCVSKCILCANNLDTTEINPICYKTTNTPNPFFVNNRKLGSLSCGCTKTQCDAKNKANGNTCITTSGYCPANTYCCTTT